MKMKWNIWFLAIMLFGFMAGCGGGGSGSSSPSTATGYFIDSPVQGLTYVSGGQAGTTDSDGKFTYEVGKTVKFSVGAISLGEVNAKGKMTPVDMVANADASNTTVLKITRFLMTLDSDGDATNGITISDATKTAAQSASQIDFSTATDADLTSALTPLTTNTTVSSSTAQTHLTSSVYGLYAGTYSGTHSGTGTSSGTLTFTIDSNGAITGTETSSFGTDSFSSQLTTSGAATLSASGVSSGGTSFSGTIDASTGVVSGTWSDVHGNSGTWTATKQTTTTTTSTTTTTTAPSTQVANNSGGRIDHVNVGNVTFTENLSYNTSLYTTDNGSYCGDGCSTGFLDVAEGTNSIVVYQTATSTSVSVGSLGSFAAGNKYAVNIRKVSGSYCAELWQRLNTSSKFNDDTTKVLIGTTCPSSSTTTTGVSQYDGTYTGSWSLSDASGTFSATVSNGAFTSCPTITSGTHGIACFSGTVSSSGAITGTGDASCNNTATFTGQITTTSSGGAQMTMTYSRTAYGTCGAESGTITATR